MVSVGTVLAIVAAIAIIVLLYTWPYIFGRNRDEYFANPPPAVPASQQHAETLLIDSIPSKNLIHALAVPDIKSLEGFQSGSVNTLYDDGNGQIYSNEEPVDYGNGQMYTNGNEQMYSNGNGQMYSSGESSDYGNGQMYSSGESSDYGNGQMYSNGNGQMYSNGNGQMYSNGESSDYGNGQMYSNGNGQMYSNGNEQTYSNGNGQMYVTEGSSDVVGGGYDIQPMDNSPMSGTAAGAGAPSQLTSYTPPLANVVLQQGPGAGASAGAGYLMTTDAEPIIEYTSVNTPLPILAGQPLPPPPPAPPSMDIEVLNSGMVPIADNFTSSSSGASEDPLSYPSFSIGSALVDTEAVNIIQANIVSGGQYTLNVTSDLANVIYSFPLQYISNVANYQNQVYAYTFYNESIVKPGPVFFGATTLNFQIVQTEPLPQTAPNAPPMLPYTDELTPYGVNSATSINNNSSGDVAFVTNSSVPELSEESSEPIAEQASEVTSEMMNSLGTKLITTLIINETDPMIKMGLVTALQNLPTNGNDIPNPGYESIYNSVADIPTDITYTQLANMYNTLPSTTGEPKPIADPANVLSMAPIVGEVLSNTEGQMNNAQGEIQFQNQIQSQAPIPPNSVTVFKTPAVNANTNIVELQTPYPSFIFPVNGPVEVNLINTIRTNLASSGEYTALITSDIPGLFYTFPLGQVTPNVIPNTLQIVNATFENKAIQKQNMIFSRANTLTLTVAQTAELPYTAPNAQLVTAPMTNPATPWANPWAPVSSNGISSRPPSTMASIIPATATVSPTNAYTFTNQSIMLDASTLAEKIRNAELIVKCNNYSPTLRTLSM